jgi:TolB-like protein/Tfp pilus assembly protein PilF
LSLLNELKRRNVFKVGIAYLMVAWLVMQFADVVLNNIAAPGWVFQALMLILAIGFPFAVIIAWAFEMTPEGLKLESEVDRSDSITPQTGKKLNFMIIAVLVLALGYFTFDKFVLTPGRDAALVEATTQAISEQSLSQEALAQSDPSIAVLPFVNMSDDSSNEYFSDGLSEELLNLLAKVPELHVTSRSSAFAFKGEKIDIPVVAKKLNVAHILEGSVRKSGDQVRITAQLIEAKADKHLWSETYDRSLDNIFAIQDEIAAVVVAKLKISLLGDVPVLHETDPQAYASYLQARHLRRQRTIESLGQAEALLEQALSVEPDYAAAWDELSAVYLYSASLGLRPFPEAYALARDAIDNSLAANPNYAPALASLSYVSKVYDNDLVAAAGYLERALQLEPTNIAIIGTAALLYSSLGRFDEATAFNEFTVRRDPVSAVGHSNLGLNYISAGRWDDAIDSFNTALRLNPGYSGTMYKIGIAQLLKGEPRAALESMQKEESVWGVIGLSMVYHALGQDGDSDEALATLIDEYGRGWAYNIAYVQAYRGDVDLAFEWLDKAVEFKDSGLSEILREKMFSNLYDDPRWLPFLKQINYAPEQLAEIQFNVKLPG